MMCGFHMDRVWLIKAQCKCTCQAVLWLQVARGGCGICAPTPSAPQHTSCTQYRAITGQAMATVCVGWAVSAPFSVSLSIKLPATKHQLLDQCLLQWGHHAAAAATSATHCQVITIHHPKARITTTPRVAINHLEKGVAVEACEGGDAKRSAPPRGQTARVGRGGVPLWCKQVSAACAGCEAAGVGGKALLVSREQKMGEGFALIDTTGGPV